MEPTVEPKKSLTISAAVSALTILPIDINSLILLFQNVKDKIKAHAFTVKHQPQLLLMNEGVFLVLN